MERYRKMEVILKDTTPDTIAVSMFQKIMSGQIEVVSKPEGAVAWAETPEAEDDLIDVIRSGNSLGCQRFPKRWGETADLTKDGELSLDGTRKMTVVTEENLADYSTLLKARPSGYDVYKAYLEALSYTALKDFIRRYPELDAELNLSSSKAVLLEETIAYFGLDMEMMI